MAKPSLQAVGENALDSFQRMTGPQRLTLGLAFAATAIGIFLVARATSSTPMSTLYADLAPDVAAEVTTELNSQGVPYELESGGRIIKVPTDQVHQVRLDLAGQNLPGAQGGYALLDDLSVTSSVLEQQIVVRRALEGELARTISAIDSVRSASVHLVMPEHDLIIDDATHASASVMVDAAGQSLAPMQVQAVVNLVASSVEGLTSDQVTLIDETGRVLAAPGGESTMLDLDNDHRLRTRMQFEETLENDLTTLLANVVGPGLAMVQVSADLDFNSVTTKTEELRPLQSEAGDQLRLTEVSNEQFYREEGAATEEGGELEVELPEDIDIDADGAVDEGVKVVIDEQEMAYAFDEVTTMTETSPGTIASLSVAVMLDEEAVDPTRLDEIETLVGAAVGLNEERGDTLAVALLPMAEAVKTAIEEAANPPEIEAGGLDLVALVRTIGTVIIALVVLLFALRYLARGPRRRVVDAVAAPALVAEGELAELEAVNPHEEEDAELGPPEERLQQLIANQTEDVAGVLRTWLTEEDEVPA